MGRLSKYFGFLAGLTPLSGFWPYVTSAAIIVTLLLIVLFRTIKKKHAHVQPVASTENEDPVSLGLMAFGQLNGASRSILLAANRLDDLPATVPINLAIRLAEKGKCLLIDLDWKRDPMATIFDIDSSHLNRDLRVRPVSTTLDNLDIWPARYFDLIKQMNLRLLLENANKKYDYILLYAPYLTSLPDRKQIASFSKQALVFSKKHTDTDYLYELIKECQCRLLYES